SRPRSSSRRLRSRRIAPAGAGIRQEVAGRALAPRLPGERPRPLPRGLRHDQARRGRGRGRGGTRSGRGSAKRLIWRGAYLLSDLPVFHKRAAGWRASAMFRRVARTVVVLVLTLQFLVVSGASADRVVATIGLGNTPCGVAVNPKTGTLYVVNLGSETVAVVN